MLLGPNIDATWPAKHYHRVHVEEFTKQSGIPGSARAACERIMQAVYEENPAHWPHGLDIDKHLVGGNSSVHLILDNSSEKAAGFVGWQEFDEEGKRIGYYTIGLLPEFRGKGLAKEAVHRIIAEKSDGVDAVRAYIAPTNGPSLALAESLGVPVQLAKEAAARRVGEWLIRNKAYVMPAVGGVGNAALWQEEHTSPRMTFLNALIGAAAGGVGSKALPKLVKGKGRGALPTIKGPTTSEFTAGIGGAAALATLTPTKDLVVGALESMPQARAGLEAAARGTGDNRALAAAILGAGALTGAGAFAASRALRRMARSTESQTGRVRLRLPTKDPNDAETEIDMPLEELALSNNLRSQLARDTRRRLRAEGQERTRRRKPKDDEVLELVGDDDAEVADIKAAASLGQVGTGPIQPARLSPDPVAQQAAQQEQQAAQLKLQQQQQEAQQSQQQLEQQGAQQQAAQKAELENHRVRLENESLKRQLKDQKVPQKPSPNQEVYDRMATRAAEVRQRLRKSAEWEPTLYVLQYMLEKKATERPAPVVASPNPSTVTTTPGAPAPAARPIPTYRQTHETVAAYRPGNGPAPAAEQALVDRAKDPALSNQERRAITLSRDSMLSERNQRLLGFNNRQEAETALQRFYDNNGNLINEGGIRNYIRGRAGSAPRAGNREFWNRNGGVRARHALEQYAANEGGTNAYELAMRGGDPSEARGYGLGNAMMAAGERSIGSDSWLSRMGGHTQRGLGSAVNLGEDFFMRPWLAGGLNAADTYQQVNNMAKKDGMGTVPAWLLSSLAAWPQMTAAVAQSPLTLGAGLAPSALLGRLALTGSARAGLIGAGGLAHMVNRPYEPSMGFGAPAVSAGVPVAGLSSNLGHSFAPGPNFAQQFNLAGYGAYNPAAPGNSGFAINQAQQRASTAFGNPWWDAAHRAATPFAGYFGLNLQPGVGAGVREEQLGLASAGAPAPAGGVNLEAIRAALMDPQIRAQLGMG